MLNEYGKKEMKAPNTQQDKTTRENKSLEAAQEVTFEDAKKVEQSSNETSEPQHKDN